MEKFLHHYGDSGKGETSVQVLTLAKGESVPLHSHANREEEYECLEGEGEVAVQGIVHPFSPGSRVMVPKGTKHEVVNTGDGELKFFAINVPGFVDGDATMHEKPAVDEEAIGTE